MSYSNVVRELLDRAADERGNGDSLFFRTRPMGEHHAKASGLEYAAGLMAGRIELIQETLERTQAEADVEPLDYQGIDRQRHLDGVVAGLEKALAILGVEVES